MARLSVRASGQTQWNGHWADSAGWSGSRLVGMVRGKTRQDDQGENLVGRPAGNLGETSSEKPGWDGQRETLVGWPEAKFGWQDLKRGGGWTLGSVRVQTWRGQAGLRAPKFLMAALLLPKLQLVLPGILSALVESRVLEPSRAGNPSALQIPPPP